IDPASGLVTDLTTTSKATASSADPGATRTQRLVHSSVLNDIGNWCLGRPLATQLSQSHTLPGGNTATRRAAATWDGQYCRPTEVTLEPGDAEWQLRHSLAYDAFGNLSRQTVTGAGVPARTTAASFGTRGQFPESLTNALGQVEAWSWRSDLGVPAVATDANGLATSWTYDSFGRATQESRADGTRARIDRYSCTNGECGDATVRYRLSVTELDTAGLAVRTDEQLLDHHGRVMGGRWPAADGRQASALRRFDLRGRLLREDLPAYAGEQAPGYLLHSWDERSRHSAVTRADASGRSDAVTAWQHSGFEVTTTDPRGASSSHYTTPWGGIVRAVDAGGGVTRYEHDAFGQLLRVIDAAGSVTTDIGYNVRGMKQRHADMDTGAWTYRNNALGEVTAVRAPGTPSTEWTSTYTYDALGRMTGRSEPEGASIWTFGNSATLHNVGQLVAMSGPGHAEAYAYDALGRLAQRSITSDAAYRYDYTYNAEGRLDTLAYPETAPGRRLVLRHEYARGELVALRDANNPATVPWQRVGADAAGRITSELLGNGVLVQSGFGALDGRLVARRVELPGANASPGAPPPAPLADLGWDWDATGNLVTRHDRLRGLSESFGYDALGRLATVSLNGVSTLSVAYDVTGNITHKSDVGSYSYHPTRRHAVTSAGASVFAYDARGQMSSRNGSAISWASYGLPTSIAGAGGSSSQFLYDAGRERHRQVSTAGGVTEQTHYIGGLLEKVVRNGVTEWKHYVVAPTGTAAIYRRAGDGTAETLYFTQDHLGSTQLVLDAAGAVLRVEQGFDAFGRRRGAGMKGVPSQADWAAIAASTRDGYTGHEHLDNLGLVHMGGRVYDPVVGRFLSADPVVQAPWDGQSLNRYAYVFNNPLSYTDPTGFQAYVPPGHDSPVDLYFGSNGAQTILPMFGFNFGGGLTQRCIAQCVANDVAWEQRWVAEARAQAAAQPFARDPGASAQPIRDFAVGMVNRLWMDALRLAEADGLADVLETYVAGTPDSPEGQFGSDMAPAISLIALRKGTLRLLGLEGRGLTVAERQAAMLKSNVGYNVSPTGWFSKYQTIGASRTAVTDREAIRSVIGRFRAGQFYTVGSKPGFGRVTYDEAARLEKALGLNPQSLKNGFKITKIGDLGSRSPRAPLEGNAQFLGRGRGLPGGGPEIEIDPVPTGF
ncbi:MAG: RHS repeat-associated core domain-containing protein, partial [Gammaproteobacteria bacterium]|nr:RHS repeat-associated core domain-containing protein [Gammaproteobacteria bacterium]